MQRRAIGLITVLIIAAVVAVSVDGGGRSGRGRRHTTSTVARGLPRTTTSSSTSTTLAATTTTRSALGSGEPVTIAFGGDVHFEGVLRQQLLANPTTMFAPITPLLSSADLTMVNLETAITERGTKESKAFNFRAPAAAFTALRAAGIDVVTMANNHGVDYGPVGLADSLAAIHDSGFPVVGIGVNEAAAYAPYRITIKGQRIAIIGATQVLDDWLIQRWSASATQAGLASAKRVDRLVEAVRAARATADTVIVYLHWGTEKQHCPNATQPPLARALVEAGADIVVGSHAHVQLGAGHLGTAFVDYGLGNFAFYSTAAPYTTTGVLRVTVTGRRVDHWEWEPATIVSGIPHPLTGSAATARVTQWQGLRACTDLAP